MPLRAIHENDDWPVPATTGMNRLIGGFRFVWDRSVVEDRVDVLTQLDDFK
jgi:hypothetical protein